MTDISKLTAAEARRWAAMHIDPKRKPEFVSVATRLVAPAAKARYISLSNITNVPWWVIAVIHEREAGQSWAGSIAQGDPWTHVSRNVPAGRGPFPSWEACGVDALVRCAPYASKWTDWTTGGTLTLLEEYNGLGYAAKGAPSPYDWSGTDQYQSGKYVRDHVYDPAAVDRQLGCAALLACMAELDPEVHFSGVNVPKEAQLPIGDPQRGPVARPLDPPATP